MFCLLSAEWMRGPRCLQVDVPCWSRDDVVRWWDDPDDLQKKHTSSLEIGTADGFITPLCINSMSILSHFQSPIFLLIWKYLFPVVWVCVHTTWYTQNFVISTYCLKCIELVIQTYTNKEDTCLWNLTPNQKQFKLQDFQ